MKPGVSLEQAQAQMDQIAMDLRVLGAAAALSIVAGILFGIFHKDDRTIAGVVGDVHQTSLETEPRDEVYLPLAQRSTPAGELVIRTSGDPYAVLPAVKAAALAVLPEVPLRNVRTMGEWLARRLAQRRLNMLLLGLFGLLGLVIAAVGISGVTVYVVSHRTHEIGVRMALGATRGKVVGMVMITRAFLVAAGLVVGGIGAWYLSAAAESFLFRVQANDPRVRRGSDHLAGRRARRQCYPRTPRGERGSHGGAESPMMSTGNLPRAGAAS